MVVYEGDNNAPGDLMNGLGGNLIYESWFLFWQVVIKPLSLYVMVKGQEEEVAIQ